MCFTHLFCHPFAAGPTNTLGQGAIIQGKPRPMVPSRAVPTRPDWLCIFAAVFRGTSARHERLWPGRFGATLFGGGPPRPKQNHRNQNLELSNSMIAKTRFCKDASSATPEAPLPWPTSHWPWLRISARRRARRVSAHRIGFRSGPSTLGSLREFGGSGCTPAGADRVRVRSWVEQICALTSRPTRRVYA